MAIHKLPPKAEEAPTTIMVPVEAIWLAPWDVRRLYESGRYDERQVGRECTASYAALQAAEQHLAASVSAGDDVLESAREWAQAKWQCERASARSLMLCTVLPALRDYLDAIGEVPED